MVNFLPSKKKRVPHSFTTVQSHTKKIILFKYSHSQLVFKEKKTHENRHSDITNIYLCTFVAKTKQTSRNNNPFRLDQLDKD